MLMREMYNAFPTIATVLQKFLVTSQATAR